MMLLLVSALAMLCSCKAPTNGAQSSDSAPANENAEASTAAGSGASEEANDASSVAYLNSAYSEAMAAYLMGEESDNVSINMVDGNISAISVSGVEISSEQANDWSGKASNSSYPAPADGGQPIANATVTFTFDAEGSITSTTYAPTAA